MPIVGGPFVQAACFCETVLTDRDGVLSLIRVIDTVTQHVRAPEPPEEMPPLTHSMKLVIMLKSGKATERAQLSVVPELPTEELGDSWEHTVHFEGGNRGHNVVVDFRFTFEHEGLYWFHICVGDDELTAIPFQVKYVRVVAGSTARSS